MPHHITLRLPALALLLACYPPIGQCEARLPGILSSHMVLRRERPALKPGGRSVVIEFYKKPRPLGPPESMKISEDEMIAEMQAAGFRKSKSFDFLPYQYFLVCVR